MRMVIFASLPVRSVAGGNVILQKCSMYEAPTMTPSLTPFLYDQFIKILLPHQPEKSRLVLLLSYATAKPPEMVRHGGDYFLSSPLLVQCVWHERCVPQAWQDAELVSIPKKDDLSSCDNWPVGCGGEACRPPVIYSRL